MLHVACVRVGEAFGVEYVERLFDMVRRNLPAGLAGRFVCLTDRPDELKHLDRVETVKVEAPQSWWAKMWLFKPALFPQGDRVLYFDLDTVICGPLDDIAQYPGAFGLLEDVYRPKGYQSSVMAWLADTPLTRSIWEAFTPIAGTDLQAVFPGGDQQFLERFWEFPGGMLHRKIGGQPWPPDLLQQQYPGQLRSYKRDCIWAPPKGTRVVFFHGRPRPHEVLGGWVPEVWKVGGGCVAELVLVGTVPQDKVLANIRATHAFPYPVLGRQPQHEKIAILCAGGPSLADNLHLLRNMQHGGAMVFAMNGTDAFLRERGIMPAFHVMCDARPEQLQFVLPGGIKLYASMCDPAVLKAGAEMGDGFGVWHSDTPGIHDLVRTGMVIGGGSTVGLRALVLAFTMGFRRVMLLGYDSSYREGEHHAYPQALNDQDRVLDCIVGGKRFKAAAWMAQQADDFRDIGRQLTQAGCEITVLGEGMLPALVSAMRDEFMEIDGLWWPANDCAARPAVLGTLDDCRRYAALCTQHRCAVQAGGNVGVWPIELAGLFAEVHTFEPDAKNWACLERNLASASAKHPEWVVFAHQAALGATTGACDVVREVGNCGATYTEERAEGGIEVQTIDSLHLEHCDLLQLDVEGAELPALKGAEATIRRCSPLIVLELKGLGHRYGYTDPDVHAWLGALGYRQYGTAHRDVIFKREVEQV